MGSNTPLAVLEFLKSLPANDNLFVESNKLLTKQIVLYSLPENLNDNSEVEKWFDIVVLRQWGNKTLNQILKRMEAK